MLNKKRFLIFYFFLLLLATNTGFSQDSDHLNTIVKWNDNAYDLRYDNPHQALVLNIKALKDVEKISQDSLTAVIYSTRGTIYRSLGLYDSATFYTLKSLRLREKIGDSSTIAKSFNNLGSIYYSSLQLKKAIKYYRIALNIRIKNELFWDLPSSFNNMGNVHEDLLNIDSAKFYYTQGLKNKAGNPNTLNDIKLNLGILFNKQNEWNNSIHVLKPLSFNLSDFYDKAFCFHNLGIAYEGIKQFDSAFYYFNKTEKILEKVENVELKKDLLRSQLILQLKKNDNTKLLHIFYEYNLLNDSLTEQIVNSDIAEVDAQYQVEKKDAEITLQKTEIELKEEKNKLMKVENEQYTLTIIALLALLVIIAILIVFVTRYYRQKRKLAGLELEQKKHEIEHLIQGYELDLFEAQNFGQQEERKRIARDLHDRLGGLLAAVNLQIESLAFTQKAETSEELRKIKAMVSDGISEVRNVSHNMQAEALKRHGLKGALKAISNSINDSKKLKVDLYLEDLGETNGSELEREVYKIIMELISNTLKHAKANLITLQINEINHELMVVYEDDGIGFSVDLSQSEGLGIGSINSRVKKLKGNWQIDSHPNKGTTIIINIPTL